MGVTVLLFTPVLFYTIPSHILWQLQFISYIFTPYSSGVLSACCENSKKNWLRRGHPNSSLQSSHRLRILHRELLVWPTTCVTRPWGQSSRLWPASLRYLDHDAAHRAWASCCHSDPQYRCADAWYSLTLYLMILP
ncbi:hypothetical protein FA95DRAFT_1001201 [Auriscalpium vulgare]|uniref:Uncharacterized protein n=1 Tax=Auriscalpium vulgare TaxID=40419 RepID=A0ACB8R674_9AGAM|nr:hypothetical protein FA95DRAFT_1001201 [Auriscalpium vulgare]